MLCLKKKTNKQTNKKTRNTWCVNIDDIVISKLIVTKTNFKYWIWYLDKVIRPLVLILPKVSGCVNTHKVKIETINWCLSESMMKSYYQNIKLLGLRLKNWKILNKLLYQTMMINI